MSVVEKFESARAILENLDAFSVESKLERMVENNKTAITVSFEKKEEEDSFSGVKIRLISKKALKEIKNAFESKNPINAIHCFLQNIQVGNVAIEEFTNSGIHTVIASDETVQSLKSEDFQKNDDLITVKKKEMAPQKISQVYLSCHAEISAIPKENFEKLASSLAMKFHTVDNEHTQKNEETIQTETKNIE